MPKTKDSSNNVSRKANENSNESVGMWDFVNNNKGYASSSSSVENDVYIQVTQKTENSKTK